MKNMKNVIKIFVAGLLVVSLNACSVTTRLPGMITDNPTGEKEGRATVKVVLNQFILNGGDVSIKTAAENGGITKISTVDYEVKSGLFVSKHTTIVTGE
ncbi:MAG: hypothetical protein ACI80H_000485 [Pseudoalteromonas distincta]|jgi:hypothetical protein